MRKSTGGFRLFIVQISRTFELSATLSGPLERPFQLRLYLFVKTNGDYAFGRIAPEQKIFNLWFRFASINHRSV